MENTTIKNQKSFAVQVNCPSKIPLKNLNAGEKENILQSYVPFLFKNKKIENVSNILNPPPGNDVIKLGHYKLKSIFQVNNNRDLLTQKYDVVMENSRKIKQSVIFKSTARRFQYKQDINQIPISYSYRFSNEKNKNKHLDTKKSIEKMNSKSFLNFKSSSIYPSIPDKSIRYGYKLTSQGKLHKINKTQDQLQKERQGMKNYIKKLNAQTQYDKKSTKKSEHLLGKKKQLMESMARTVRSSISQKKFEKIQEKVSLKKWKVYGRIAQMEKKKQKQGVLQKILEEKEQIDKNLGPGSYQLNSNYVNQFGKPQKFQFFNSTSERFNQNIKNNPMNTSQNLLRKIEIQNKILQSKKAKCSNIWKRLKKPPRSSDKTTQSIKQYVHPGPGDYNPNQNLTKINVGKNKVFDKSTRFSNKVKQYRTQKEQKGVILTAKTGKRHSNNVKSNQRSNYGKIIKLLRNKKTQVQIQYRKYITKGQSEYSICSWENRPISRNQTFPTMLKQIPKNQH